MNSLAEEGVFYELLKGIEKIIMINEKSYKRDSMIEELHMEKDQSRKQLKR